MKQQIFKTEMYIFSLLFIFSCSQNNFESEQIRKTTGVYCSDIKYLKLDSCTHNANMLNVYVNVLTDENQSWAKLFHESLVTINDSLIIKAHIKSVTTWYSFRNSKKYTFKVISMDSDLRNISKNFKQVSFMLDHLIKTTNTTDLNKDDIILKEIIYKKYNFDPLQKSENFIDLISKVALSCDQIKKDELNPELFALVAFIEEFEKVVGPGGGADYTYYYDLCSSIPWKNRFDINYRK